MTTAQLYQQTNMEIDEQINLLQPVGNHRVLVSLKKWQSEYYRLQTVLQTGEMSVFGALSQLDMLQEQFRKEKVPANVGMLNAVLSICNTLPLAERYFNKYLILGVAPNETTYSIMVSKCDTPEKAKKYFDQMAKDGIAPNASIINTLIANSEHFDAAIETYMLFETHQVTPNEQTGYFLLALCQNQEDIASVIDEMSHFQITLSEDTFSLLIHNAPDFNAAMMYAEYMNEIEMPLSEEMCFELLEKTNDSDELRLITAMYKGLGFEETEQWNDAVAQIAYDLGL